MQKLRLSEEQKKELLKKVRYVLETKLFGKSEIKEPLLGEAVFSEQFGLFVTLSIESKLRGCIGYIEGFKPIREAVREMAVHAAFHDPRFHPLAKEEYPGLEIEISILYPLEPVSSLEEIQVGRDGLVLERGGCRGLLLPQVATECGWDRDTFLNQTCRKAGMEPRCWENGAKLYRFEAVVFYESEMR